MLRPSRRHFLQELRIGDLRQTLHRRHQMGAQLFRNPIVQESAVLVEDQVVGVSVELLEGELGRIAVVDLVNGVGQDIPNRLGRRSIHGNVRSEGLWWHGKETMDE